MNSTDHPPPAALPAEHSEVENYYRFHAAVYDATRWSFLFGREAVLQLARSVAPAPKRILEVGCGTGRNLVRLAELFPASQITGVDLSAAMLAVARKKTARFDERVQLLNRAYDKPVQATGPHQLVLCSYALSMFNPGYDAAVAAARGDLAPGGYLAFVDFHSTRFRWFARWMRVNHVRMDGHLHPLLRANFTPVIDERHAAYGGVWDYRVFIGRRAS
jgi:S-adenosylmethionine-diacylgycerolhomoserine-N-methlytransferase